MSENKMPKILACIQARTGSTRLPNKVMRKIMGKEALLYMYDRVALANSFTIGKTTMLISALGKFSLTIFRAGRVRQ